MDGHADPTPTPDAVPAPAAMEILTEDECWSLLATVEVGRVAMAVAGEVDIFPINFVTHERTLLFRTAAGTKLAEIALTGRLTFEADGHDPATGLAWSVVCKGEAAQLARFDDIYRAQELPLHPWHDAPKEEFVRVSPDSVTGRRFHVRRRTGPA